MRFVVYLGIIFSLLPDHRPAISGVDLIVNDISNPYTQREINEIANIKVIKNGEDITKEMILVTNEYLNNERLLGFYKQTYQVINKEFDGENYIDVIYQYVLTIYNINANTNYKDIVIKTNPKSYLSINEIIKRIELELNISIFKYEILSNNYYDNGIEGNYIIELEITNRKNEKQHLKVCISSHFEERKQFSTKFILFSVIVSLIVLTIVFSLIRRRKKK